jgi:hypothetical protein
MKRIVNECVGCPPEIGCFGDSCPNRNVPRYYCDECGDNAPLYEYEGGEYCIECIKKMLDVVEGSE